MVLQVLAAGSLRYAWQPLMVRFEQETGIQVATQFGPAGILRERIEMGAVCDLFASANMAHPQALAKLGKALEVRRFAGNRLCLTAAVRCVNQRSDWLSLLSDPALKLATSTPVSDPSGDYAWQFFKQLQMRYGLALQGRATPLVGGPRSEPIPQGQLAAAWLLESGQADLFIGYRSYAGLLNQQQTVRVFDIPQALNISAEYGLALCNKSAESLLTFLLSPVAQKILQHCGFEP